MTIAAHWSCCTVPRRVRQAEALLDRSERFFGLATLGTDMQGSAMHQTLLAAYDKLFSADR